MKRLKYISDDAWQKLPVADFRARFFVETYCEKLSMYTPHFYQSRLMNVFSACSEMLEYIKEYQSNDRNGAYVASSIEEIRDAWDSDPVVQEQLADLMPLRAGLLRNVQSGELGPNTLHRLKAFCRAILCRKDEYAEAIFSALNEAVIGATDLTQRGRITSQIDRLTGLYTSYLLNEGYSPTYLFNRSDLLSKEKNYGDRDFAAQFRSVTGRLQSHRAVVFDVYYGLHTNKPSVLTSIVDEEEIEFLTELPADIQGSVLEKFRKNIDINVVVKAKISSTDYVSAALRTKERLDRFLDAATALEFSS